MPALVLASTSPRRRELLARIGLVPARIAALEAEQKTIAEQLADNDLYAKSPAQVPVLQARFAQIDDDLLAAMERWEALSAPA